MALRASTCSQHTQRAGCKKLIALRDLPWRNGDCTLNGLRDSAQSGSVQLTTEQAEKGWCKANHTLIQLA